ncbi:MAG: peptidyl-prolyl cis-trans isomerase [Anaerolineales bacterium]|nr:peptidyl-prolyl cis-trans isomerase [Anaerolineales bacterium]
MLPFPSKKRSKEEVLATMRTARDHDVQWRQGRAFGLIYHIDQNVDELLQDAFTMFFAENGLNPTAFPSLKKFETEVVAMSASLLGGDAQTRGNMTSGGTGSLLCAVVTARNWARENRPAITAPEIVLARSAHPAFEKAAHYFGLKTVYVPVRDDLRADVSAMIRAVTPNTILMVGSAPAYPHGVVDPSQRVFSPAQTAPMASPVPAQSQQPTTPSVPANLDNTQLDNAKLIAGGQILARINGQIVLASDVLWQVEKLIEANLDRIPPQEIANVRTMLLRQQVLKLVDTKLLYADFRRTVPAESIPQIEENLAKPFEENEIPRLIKLFEVKDRRELAQMLRAGGSSLNDVRLQFNQQTIAGEWLRQITPKPKPVTHEDLLNDYQKRLDEYKFPAKVRWEELAVRFDRVGNDRAAAWRAITQLGNEVWQQVATNPKVRGSVFAKVAQEKSHGITAKQGGQHDWTTQGAMRSEAIDQAIFTLKLGQMSSVLESEQGFHIVRVLERTEAGQTPFTEAQAEIRKKINLQRRRELSKKQLAKLRKKCCIWTVFDGQMSAERVAELMQPTQRR